MPIAISYYLLGSAQEEKGKRLIESCMQWGVDADICGIEIETDAQFKPLFILEQLRRWKRPVLWVEPSAVFLQKPIVADFDSCDFSARLNEFLPKGHPSRILSKTVFARHNARAEKILEAWGNAPSDEGLRDAIDAAEGLHFLPLPLKYCKSFHYDKLFISRPEIVIEHEKSPLRQKKNLHVLAFPPDHCSR